MCISLTSQGYPAEFAMYLNYCRSLRFEEGPDYIYLRQLFRILFRTLGYQYDYVFDWTILKQKASASKQSSSRQSLQNQTQTQTQTQTPGLNLLA